MSQIQETIHKLKYPGAVDADGHILESAKCWEENCEQKYRTNALRLREDKEGLQYFEINGKPSRVNRAGTFGFAAFQSMRLKARTHSAAWSRLRSPLSNRATVSNGARQVPPKGRGLPGSVSSRRRDNT